MSDTKSVGQEDFLKELWREYRVENDLLPEEVDPDAFIRWGYRRLLDHRLPRYRAIAERWGVTVPATAVAHVRTASDFTALVADHLS